MDWNKCSCENCREMAQILKAREEAFTAKDTIVKRDGREIELKTLPLPKLCRAINAARGADAVMDTSFAAGAFIRAAEWAVAQKLLYWRKGRVVINGRRKKEG